MSEPLPISERMNRAAWWPVVVPRLMFKVGLRASLATRWRIANQRFHMWVWGYAPLP